MSLVDLIMPKLGESIMEATILKWLKKPGDKVEQDETILEIATDKVDSEVPSTTNGVIAEILFNENDVVPIGKVIARINTEINVAGNNTAPANDKPSLPKSRDYEEASLIEDIPYRPSEKTSS
jgi:2-oxoglutarate dehydrogenase E2 component (dihydrolipoamide succinyltransferase)